MDNKDRESEMAPVSFSSDDKSLAQWRYELRTLGRKHWNTFYKHFLDTDISNYARFFRALKLYDGMYIFEAVLETSKQELTADPLGYVLKVAHELWKRDQLEYERSADYEQEIKEAILQSHKKNEGLAKRLKKIGR